MSKPLVILKNVTTGYQSKTVLKEVSLDVFPNDFIGVLGPNGGGKTTLMKVVLGLLPVFSGELEFPSGRPATGYLPQVTQVDKSFPITVKELISSGLKDKNAWFPHPGAALRKTLQQMLDEAGLATLASVPIGELSGGQLQKALLCRALINRPKLLILDEPNTHVDKQFEMELYNWLQELNQDMAILLVSHDIGTITPMVKTIACVNKTLHYHPTNQLTEEVLKVYNCPVDIIAHGPIPHRVLKSHDHIE